MTYQRHLETERSLLPITLQENTKTFVTTAYHEEHEQERGRHSARAPALSPLLGRTFNSTYKLAMP